MKMRASLTNDWTPEFFFTEEELNSIVPQFKDTKVSDYYFLQGLVWLKNRGRHNIRKK